MTKKVNKDKGILEILTDIYIFVILIVFPLMVDKTGFFHILECKWYSYVSISSFYFISCVLVLLYSFFIKKENLLKRCTFTRTQLLACIFLFVLFLSFFFSPFRKDYNLLVGVGRGEGLIVSSFYILSFLFVSLFGKFKKSYILYFPIASILLNTVAILQFIGFNPFHMYQDGIGIHNVSFLTTIGNIDFVSALYCILLSVSFGAFVFLEDERKLYKAIHLVSIFMIFMMIAIMDVLNSKLSPFVTLVIIFPFIISHSKRLSRFVLVVATILMSYCTNLIINPQYDYNNPGLRLHFTFNWIVIMFLIVIGILIYLSKVLRSVEYNYSNHKKFICYFYMIIIGVGLLGVGVLYFHKFSIGVLSEIHELLHGNFDDDFGTYRIFLWKRTLKIIPEYPILGSGPDTFVIRFMRRYTEDIAALGELTLNDTAANVYLTMIINLGFVGLFAYLSFLFSQIKFGIQRMNRYSVLLLIAIVCYCIQDFFSLSVVIVTPVFWLLMVMHFLSIHSIESIDRKKSKVI